MALVQLTFDQGGANSGPAKQKDEAKHRLQCWKVLGAVKAPMANDRSDDVASRIGIAT